MGASEQPTRPVEPCGARVCGMHPAHLYTRDGQSTQCPGDPDLT